MRVAWPATRHVLLVVASLEARKATVAACRLEHRLSRSVSAVTAASRSFKKADLSKVAVGVSGTIGGFRKFCAGETDISGASRPITSSESGLCRQNGIEYIEVPIAYDGLSVLVNPKNDWARDITITELKKMWEPAAKGTVTRWSQIRQGWPDKELHLYGAGVDSGTYDYFTEAVVGTQQHSNRSDYIDADDDALVKDVAGDELGLGFFGYMYYAKNKDKLKVLAVDDENPSNGAGPITPSPETTSERQPTSRCPARLVYVAEKALARPQRRLVHELLSRARLEARARRPGRLPRVAAGERLCSRHGTRQRSYDRIVPWRPGITESVFLWQQTSCKRESRRENPIGER